MTANSNEKKRVSRKETRQKPKDNFSEKKKRKERKRKGNMGLFLGSTAIWRYVFGATQVWWYFFGGSRYCEIWR